MKTLNADFIDALAFATLVSESKAAGARAAGPVLNEDIARVYLERNSTWMMSPQQVS